MSPQKLFAVVVLLITLALACPGDVSTQNANAVTCLERERQALVKFKAELVDESGRLSSWGDRDENNSDCCEWRGVHCDNTTHHVIRLDLHTPQEEIDNLVFLRGTISTSLLELQHLQYLDLSFNDFSTSIPEFIGSLSELRYLYLSYCYFTGPIPYHLGNQSKLITLDLSGNFEVTGPIPEFLGSLSQLIHLDLSWCNFTGPIPYHLGNLSKLLTLNLGDNHGLHSENLVWVLELHSLEVLDLSGVDLALSNNWLEAISKLTSIKELHLSNSRLPNILPSLLPPINASISLNILDLRYNLDLTSILALTRWFSNFSSSIAFIDLSGIDMQGPIPDVFQNMVALEHLSLLESGLQGSIPKYFGNMSSLRHLRLKFNNLTQASECCLQLPYLEVLDLTSNIIKGPLPNLSGCPSLEEVRLDENMFNGTLNGQIGGLSKLEVLSIGSNLLEGMITEAHMFNLSQLRQVDLSFNSRLTIKFNPDWIPSFQLEYIALARCTLGPNFPAWLQTQKKLKFIDISDAGITDTIPTWFGNVTKELASLNASNNQIHGVIPQFSFSNKHVDFLSSRLMLDLSNNKVSGPINFLCTTENWWLIDLSENQLSGQIPRCFQKFASLEYLNLANNHFLGEIPILSSGELSVLNLQNNKFTGEFPTSLRNCTNLDIIDLGENRLMGEIPAWIGNSLPGLKVLILRSNEFYGSIPTSLCKMEDVQILDMSANNISGIIPKCVFKWTSMTGNTGTYSRIIELPAFADCQVIISPKVVESAYFMWKGNEIKYINHLGLGLVKLLDLSTNSLHGEIPSEITALDGLIGLNLSRNNLVGFIPPNIGEMKNMDFLDLSRNNLSGSIPPSISGLSHLGMLNLSYNNLSGRIPQDNQALTFLESDFVGNPGLCGPPLINKPCPGDQKPHTPSSTFKKTPDSNDGELVTDGFYVSVAIGFVCAFLGVFWTTVLNKSIGDALFSKVFRRFH